MNNRTSSETELDLMNTQVYTFHGVSRFINVDRRPIFAMNVYSQALQIQWTQRGMKISLLHPDFGTAMAVPYTSVSCTKCTKRSSYNFQKADVEEMKKE